MGCQKVIAQTILDQKGDYLLAVKGNQKTLYQSIRTALTSLSGEEGYRQIENGHGRHEYREYHVCSASEIEGLPNWPGLKTVGVATRYSRNTAGHEMLEHRHYMNSAVFSTEDFAQSVRSHWDVENRLHWVLDVAFEKMPAKLAEAIALITWRRYAMLPLTNCAVRPAKKLVFVANSGWPPWILITWKR